VVQQFTVQMPDGALQPTRKPPHDKPFLATLYFVDPFWGKPKAEFCSPQCSLKWHEEGDELPR
jgi:hypothetical protein